jgi:hypothetical protein
MLSRITMAVAGAMLFASAAPASAQMVEARNPASVQAALASNGYKPEMKKDSGGDPLILIDSQGYKMMVLFFGCKNNVDCKSVSFYSAFTAPKKLDAAPIMLWNQKHRFGRAFLDSEGDPSLQFDVDLDDGGMSTALFIDNLEWFTVAFDNLKTEMKK